ncbi:MAG: hypothetical protein V4629_05235 [Pseudomonadota bacterium]
MLNNVGSPQFIGEYIRRIVSAVESMDSNAILMGPDPEWYDPSLLNPLLGGYADITGKDAQGRFYIDVITWHTYNFNDIAKIEENFKDMKA